jgi:hypothetical protein
MMAKSTMPIRIRLLFAVLVLVCVASALYGSRFATAATPPLPPAPTVVGAAASQITFSSVVLSCSINAHGKPTNYYFQYGTTSGYGAQTPLAPGGSATSPVAVSRQVSGLQPATIYHYRLVAINAAGTATSQDHTFTTPKLPLSLAIAGVPNPLSYGSPLTVEGNLTGTGSANHAVVLQVNPFPYTAGFKTLGNPELTSPTGAFSFPVVGLLENAQLRVQTVGAPLVTSPIVTESVAIRVDFHVRRLRRRHGHRYVKLYGTVAPAEAGALVGFQLLIGPDERTVNVGGTVVKPATATTSRFSRIIRLRHSGIYRALVKVNDGAHISAYSAPILVR